MNNLVCNQIFLEKQPCGVRILAWSLVLDIFVVKDQNIGKHGYIGN